METLSIIFSSISAFVVVVAILFEGKFKKMREKSSLIPSITVIGYIFIALSLLMCFGNGYTNYRNIVDNKAQTKKDSIRFSAKNKEDSMRFSGVNILLRKKNITDSIKIDSLISLTKDNGLKIIENGVKVIKEQIKKTEQEHQNVFIHLQKEIKDNLFSILYHYEEKNIRLFEDTTMFILERLRVDFINKYGLISTNKTITDRFSPISEKINRTNFFADELLTKEDRKLRKLGINTFLQLNEEILNRLIPIYYCIDKLKSYKEFESSDLSIKELSKNGHTINRQQLKDSLKTDASFLIYDKESLEKLNRYEKLREIK